MIDYSPKKSTVSKRKDPLYNGDVGGCMRTYMYAVFTRKQPEILYKY